MRELNRVELDELLKQPGEISAVFFFTPLCGTCKLAGRMLDIVHIMLKDLPLYSCNINFIPDYAQTWEITSIPCLALIERGTLIRKMYQMNSVDELYQQLKPYYRSKGHLKRIK